MAYLEDQGCPVFLGVKVEVTDFMAGTGQVPTTVRWIAVLKFSATGWA